MSLSAGGEMRLYLYSRFGEEVATARLIITQAEYRCMVTLIVLAFLYDPIDR